MRSLYLHEGNYFEVDKEVSFACENNIPISVSQMAQQSLYCAEGLDFIFAEDTTLKGFPESSIFVLFMSYHKICLDLECSFLFFR